MRAHISPAASTRSSTPSRTHFSRCLSLSISLSTVRYTQTVGLSDCDTGTFNTNSMETKGISMDSDVAAGLFSDLLSPLPPILTLAFPPSPPKRSQVGD